MCVYRSTILYRRLDVKRIIIFVLTAVILLSMGGCTKKKADNTVEVFCLNMDVTSSVPESYVLRSKNSDVDKQVDELLGRLQDKPEDSRLRKAIPDEVSVRGHDEKNYNCTVDFSKEYYDLTAAQEVLLRASVVRTLTQLDSISYVTFTVNSIPLVDSDDEIVGSMGFDKIAERIYNYPEVKSVYLISGGFDLMVTLEGKTLREVSQFVTDKLSTLDQVLSTKTNFILKKYKDHGTIMAAPVKSDERGIMS